MVFQLNQIAGKSKAAATAKRRLNQRECSLGIGFVGELALSTMVITSIEPVPSFGDSNRDDEDGYASMQESVLEKNPSVGS
jgi:hypothetical protein